jgi:ATP-dependent Clp protease ATP-binding subunit ClpB
VIVDQAEQLSKKAGDSFVTVERLLTALALVKSDAKEALDAGAVTRRPECRDQRSAQGAQG